MAVARRLEEVTSQHFEQAEKPAITEAQIMALLQTAMSILGARLLLVIGLIGAIALAYLALQSSSQFALWAQCIFSGTVFIPLVWLSTKRSI